MTTNLRYSVKSDTLGPFRPIKITDHANSFSNQRAPPRMLFNRKNKKRRLGWLSDSKSSMAQQHKGLADVGVLLQAKENGTQASKSNLKVHQTQSHKHTHTMVYTPEA